MGRVFKVYRSSMSVREEMFSGTEKECSEYIEVCGHYFNGSWVYTDENEFDWTLYMEEA